MIWQILTKQRTNVGAFECSIDVQVNVGYLFPYHHTDKFTDKTLEDLGERLNKDEDEDDTEDHRKDTDSTLAIQKFGIGRIELRLRLALPDRFFDATSLIHLTLPAVTVNAKKQGGHNLAVQLEELDLSFERYQYEYAIFSIESDRQAWYNPLVDLMTANATHSSLDIQVQAEGSFLEALLGKTHSINLD